MEHESRELAAFYDSPLGQVARRMIGRRLRAFWPDVRGLRVLGYGFATPYLRPFLSEADQVAALIPEQLGPTVAPETPALSVLGEEDALPFPDALFDRVLIVHGLEGAEAIRPLMRQIWRVLAPAGRVAIVAPNRTSLWSQVERSPFAYGRPFNRGQLDTLLRESMFVPEHWDSALLFPPLHSRRLLRSGVSWERAGTRFWPRLAGVHLVEATKSLYALTPVGPARLRKRALAPAN